MPQISYRYDRIALTAMGYAPDGYRHRADRLRRHQQQQPVVELQLNNVIKLKNPRVS